MSHDNFFRCLEAFTQRRPFRPFVIQMNTGETLLVTHPEILLVADEVIVFVEAEAGRRLFDASSVCQFFEAPPATASEAPA
jgi:hypothetical protein